MKHKKHWIQLLIGLAIAFLLMWQRGLFSAQTVADRFLIVCDGMTIVAFLYLGIGSLIWVSTTGWFDIFGYAFKKCAHAFIPGLVHENVGKYYDYKMKKCEERKPFSERSTLIIGTVFLVCSIIFTVVWYMLAE